MLLGFDEGRAVPDTKMTSRGMMALCENWELQFPEARLEHLAHDGPM
jgi:hypothetical protein